MDSPEAVFSFTSSSYSSSDAPFFNYASNLSSIESINEALDADRFSQNSLLPLPPVFISPCVDLQWETGFTRREDDPQGSDVREQNNASINAVQISGFDKEVQLCSPRCIDEYLDHLVEANFKNSMNLCFQPSINNNDVSDVSDNLPVSLLRLAESGVCQGNGRLNEVHESNCKMDLGPDFQADNYEFPQNTGFRYQWDSHSNPDDWQLVQAYINSGESSMTIPIGFDKVLTKGASNIPIGFDKVLHARACKNALRTNRNSFRVQSLASESSLHPSELGKSNQNVSNHAPFAPTPSGVGLHVNIIGSSGSMGSEMFSEQKLVTHCCSKQGNLRAQSSNYIQNDVVTNSNLNSAITGKVSCHVDNEQKEYGAVINEGGAMIKKGGRPYKTTATTSQNTDMVESKQINPKRESGETSGRKECKPCYCKKSQCLKLYCKCFSAGELCMASCSCQNCKNKPNLNRVFKRKKIEDRNPLAFAPKIVIDSSESLKNVVGEESTSSSARHIRGCNCKKSKCSRNYCQCYLVEVGCSGWCRCEDCMNTFGIRPRLS